VPHSKNVSLLRNAALVLYAWRVIGVGQRYVLRPLQALRSLCYCREVGGDYKGNLCEKGYMSLRNLMSSYLILVISRVWFVCSVFLRCANWITGHVWNLSVVRSFFIMSTGGARSLRVLLSFAVGCLLGDVFLHLLPEVWMEQQQTLVGKSYCVWSKNCSAEAYIFLILKVRC
jgi:hypothetical protein